LATSHGKSPRDGIGGTVKRIAARASLQATTSGQILTPSDMFSWAETHIPGVKFIYMSDDDTNEHQKHFALIEWYAAAKTINGTQSHHAFIPLSLGTMMMTIISADMIHSNITVSEDACPSVIPVTEPLNLDTTAFQTGKYIACTYDDKWYVGNIVDRSDANSDILVSFMNRTVGNKLSWPRREDKCWIPFQHIYYVLLKHCMLTVTLPVIIS